MVEFRGYREETEDKALDLAHLRRLWPFVRPYRRGFALCLLILLVSFCLELLGPWLLRCALDGPVADASAGREADTGLIAMLGVAYLVITLGSMGLGFGYAMLTARNGQRVLRDVRVQLFEHLLRVSPRYHDDNPAGKLVTRTTSDVENLNELISTGVLQTLFDLLKIVGITGLLFAIHLELALLLLVATPVLVAVSVVFRRFVRDSYRKVRGQLARQNAFTAEAMGGVRITRAFGQEAAVQNHYAEVNRGTRNAWLRTILHFALFVSLVELCVGATRVGMIWVGGSSILAGSLKVGVFVQFWLYFSKLTDPIRELGEKYNVLQSALSSTERIFAILDEPELPRSPDDPVPAGSGPGEVRFENVDFAYRPDRPVLHDVSLDVPAGTTTAIVGPTGAGKSTLLALVSRLTDPTSGRVLLDGTPLDRLDLSALRRRVAVVPQDVFLFTGTILDNVRLFDAGISEARVLDALETVGARAMVEGLEGGLQAPVEERGATLSLGQRQLLSFARALVTDPDVLVLDEATANIDSESEALIQAGLEGLLRDRTCLVVAHRLSTVRGADQILVLQQGRIVERGVHRALMRADGVYAGIVRKTAPDRHGPRPPAG